MIFTRRGFLGLLPAAFVTTNLTAHGETLPTAIVNRPISLSGIPTGQAVVERRLYVVSHGDPPRHRLIATAGPNDREWRYIGRTLINPNGLDV